MVKSVVALLSTLTEESRQVAEVAEETIAEDGIRRESFGFVSGIRGGLRRIFRFSVRDPVSRHSRLRLTRGLHGDQIAGARIARRAFVGPQLNVGTAWLYQCQLHLPGAGGARQLRGLKMGTAWRRRRDFHGAYFRKS